jgi:hypothetical protein
VSVADRIAAKVEALRPRYEDVAMPDWCEVVRPVQTADGRGGHTAVPTVVEQTRCVLSVSQRSGTEGIASDQLVGITVYTCDLPFSTLLTEDDTLRINGRDFAVVSVGWEEGFAIGKTALLEARS